MAVLGASRAYKDWSTASGADLEASEGDEDTEAAHRSQESLYSDEQLQEMENADALELMDSITLRIGDAQPPPPASRKLGRIWGTADLHVFVPD